MLPRADRQYSGGISYGKGFIAAVVDGMKCAPFHLPQVPQCRVRGGVIRVVASHGTRLNVFQTVAIYRPATTCALTLLAFAVVSITWAFQLKGNAVSAESLAGSELVASRVAGFLNLVSQVAAPSGYREAIFVLVGAIIFICVVSVGTVVYLNVALVRARNLLKSQKSDLRSLDVVKERFLTSVTHELNTPITVATALTDVLARNRDGNLTERQLEQLAVVRRNNKRLSDNVDAMIRASTAGVQLGLITETVHYSEFVETTLESLRNDIALQGIRVQSSSFPTRAKVDIDLDRISQVITNLLINAAHNSPEGSVISVSIERLENAVKTNIRDSGTGISAQDSDYVFSPFYRSDTESTRRIRGLGLGLTMVQRIVELHGGEVGFEPNRDDAGVTFWFTLPTIK